MVIKTTQEIYNKIQEIQKNGNWIENPFRQVNWIPIGFIEKILNDFDKQGNTHIKTLFKNRLQEVRTIL